MRSAYSKAQTEVMGGNKLCEAPSCAKSSEVALLLPTTMISNTLWVARNATYPIPFIDPTPVMMHTLPLSFPLRGATSRCDWMLARRATVRFQAASSDSLCFTTGWTLGPDIALV